jgi:hypothetical protein
LCIREWWIIIGQLSVPLDYFAPIRRAREHAQSARIFLWVILPCVAYAFHRLHPKLSIAQRFLATTGLGLGIAVLVLYVTTPLIYW